eukprot:6091290-Alexandrium_andersonii.AAC.1
MRIRNKRVATTSSNPELNLPTTDCERTASTGEARTATQPSLAARGFAARHATLARAERATEQLMSAFLSGGRGLS